jgi:hypothetical protein
MLAGTLPAVVAVGAVRCLHHAQKRTSGLAFSTSALCHFRSWARAIRMSALRLRKRTSPHRLAIFWKSPTPMARLLQHFDGAFAHHLIDRCGLHLMVNYMCALD